MQNVWGCGYGVQLTFSGVGFVIRSVRLDSIGGEGGYGEVGEEEFPALIAPEHFQTEQGFIPFGAPELGASFHATLQLATGRFDRAGAQGFTELLCLLVLHSVLVVAVILDGAGSGLGGRCVKPGMKLVERANDFGDFVAPQLFKQWCSRSR